MTEQNLDFLVDADGQVDIVVFGTVKALDADDLTSHAVLDAQRAIFDFAGFFTKDGAEQTLFCRQFGFTLGGDFADEDVIGVDFGTDIDDTAVIEVAQAFGADVGDVAGDFFGSEFGFARFDFVAFDVDRGKDVFADQALADEDGVFEVPTFPRHEGHQHVLTESQFAVFGGRTINDDFVALDPLATHH